MFSLSFSDVSFWVKSSVSVLQCVFDCDCVVVRDLVQSSDRLIDRKMDTEGEMEDVDTTPRCV